MGRVALGVVGGVVGYYFGGPQGAAYGFSIGYGVGAATEKKPNIEGPRLEDLRLTTSSYGQPIPWLRGSPRVSGQIVWASEKREVATTSGGGKGGGPETTSYTYEVDVLVMLCDHEAAALSRIWSNGKLVWTRRPGATNESLAASDGSNLWQRLTFYPGEQSQLPDPTYEAAVGVGNAPAYRGRATLMIEGLQLGGSGQLPNLTFEVMHSASSEFGTASEGPSVSMPGGAAGTPAASGATTFRVHLPQWDANYATNNVRVYDVDLLQGTSSLVSSYNVVTNTQGAGAGTSDVPCLLLSGESSGRLYSGDTGTLVTMAYTEEIGSAQVRFARKMGSIVVGSSLFGSRRLRRFSVATGTLQATGPVLAGYVSSIVIKDQWVYAVLVGGTSVVRMDLLTLSVQATLTITGAASYSWPILFDTGFSVGAITARAAAPGSSTLGIFTLGLDGSTWTQAGTIGPQFIDGGQYDLDTVGVVGGLLVGGRIGTSPQRYFTWSAPAVTTPGTATLQDVVTSLCERAGMPAGSYDTSALASITRPVRSIAVATGPTRGTLEQLGAAFFFNASLRDKLYFRPRGGAVAATIQWSDLAASSGRGADDQSLPLTVGNELELPPQTAVTYINVSDDAQSGTEYSDRMSLGQAAVRTVNLGLGMTPADAKGVADALQADAAAALVSGAIALPITYARLDPADVVNVVDQDGRTYRLRLERKRDELGVLAFEVARDDASALTSAAITDTTQTIANTVTRAGDTVFQALDVPLLRDVDDAPGYYVAAKGSTGTWPGGVVLSSSNDVDFATVAEVTESAVFGTCTTTLGDFAGVGMDERNTLTVNVGSGELSSATREALLADGALNALLVGDEVIRFQRATLVSPGVYILSGLLRGQRGTEWAMGSHGANERCVLLRTRGLRRVTQQAAEVGQVRYLRGGTLGATPSATSVQFTNTNRGLRPFAPVDARAVRLPSGDLQITWKRRTRLSTRLTGPAGINAPEDFSPLSFEVLLYRDSGRTQLVRTLTSSTQTATYTAAQLSSDSALYQDSVLYTRIRQISPAGQRSPNLDAALRPDLTPSAASAVMGPAALLLPFGGADFTASAVLTAAGQQTWAVLATATAGASWTTAYRGQTAPAAMAGVSRLHAATSARRLSIGWNYSGGVSPEARAVAYIQTSNAGVPTRRIDDPRVSGTGAYIFPYALTADSTTFYLVGRAESDALSGSGMYLYTCTDGFTWSLQGQLVQDGGDPNAITAQLGAFTGDLFAGITATDQERRLQKIGSRWFLASRFAAYYTDNAAALTGWKRCPTGLGEGSTNPWPVLTHPIAFDGKLVIVRRDPTSGNCLAYSSDNGATWTAVRPAAVNSFEPIADAYAAHGHLVLQLGTAVARNTALPGTWTRSAVAGLNDPFAFAAVGGSAAIALDNLPAAAGQALRYSTDSITWTAATVDF